MEALSRSGGPVVAVGNLRKFSRVVSCSSSGSVVRPPIRGDGAVDVLMSLFVLTFPQGSRWTCSYRIGVVVYCSASCIFLVFWSSLVCVA